MPSTDASSCGLGLRVLPVVWRGLLLASLFLISFDRRAIYSNSTAMSDVRPEYGALRRNEPYAVCRVVIPVCAAASNSWVTLEVYSPSCASRDEPHVFAAMQGDDGSVTVLLQHGGMCCGCWGQMRRAGPNRMQMDMSVCDDSYLEDFQRIFAAIAAAFKATSGGELWSIRVAGRAGGVVEKLLFFAIGRSAISVKEKATGSTVVTYTTTGRGATYSTKSALCGPDCTERRVSCVPASHPQLPLLRVVVAAAVAREVRLAGAKVQWVSVAAPPMVALRNARTAIALVDPCVVLAVYPVAGGPQPPAQPCPPSPSTLDGAPSC